MFRTTVNPTYPQRTKRAFTLIELLVVIAIIAILAAILFPVFARARENARRSSCQSNEKQMGLGLLQYAQDYDERLPVYTYGNAPGYWHTQVQPYVKSYQIFRCPSARRPGSSATNELGYYYPTYGFNGGGGGGLYRSTNGRTLASIDEPAVTWMVVETGHPTLYYSYGYGFAFSALYGVANPDVQTYFRNDVHLEGSNVLYADGHVKWRKAGASVTGQNWQGS